MPYQKDERGDQPHRIRRSTRSAFSLTEMLVALSIMAVLVALALPAFSVAREAVSTAKCSNNLRCIGQALALYASENNNCIPSVYDTYGITWDVALLPYLGNITSTFHCPNDKWSLIDSSKFPRSYAANGGYNWGPDHALPFGSFNYSFNRGDSAPHRLNNLTPFGARLILIGERPGESAANRGVVGDFAFCSLDQLAGTLHRKGRGGNYLFADMSVEYFTSQQIVQQSFWFLK